MKKFITSFSAFSLILLTASCGGGGEKSSVSFGESEEESSPSFGGNSSIGQTLTGTFIDAPVSGIQYITTSGITGTTGNKGEFNYKEGDTITFFVGKVFVLKAKAASIVTPLSAIYESTKDYTKAKETAQKIIAFLLAIDDNPNDDVITIAHETIQKYHEIENKIVELYNSQNSDLQTIYVDKNGQQTDLYTLINTKLPEAETHFENTSFSLIQQFLYNSLNKNYEVNGEICSYALGTDTYITVQCTNNTYRFTIQKKNGTVYAMMDNGTEYPFIKITNDEACLDYTGQELCFKITEDAPAFQPDNGSQNPPAKDIPKYILDLKEEAEHFLSSKVGSTVTFLHYDGQKETCDVLSSDQNGYVVSCPESGKMNISFIPKDDYLHVNINSVEYRMSVVSTSGFGWFDNLKVNYIF